MEKFEDFYYTSKDKCDHRFEDEKYRNAYYSNLETWNHQQAKIDKLEAEKRELVEALEKSVEYLKQSKVKFAPHTTNSFVDEFIEKWEAKIKSEEA